MRLLTSFVFAVGAGLVGAVLWAVLASSLERELIGLAVVVAMLCGLGARLGARQRTGVLSGFFAVVAAFFAIGVGIAVPTSGDRIDRLSRVDQQFQSAPPPYSRDVLISYIARGVADEWEAQGRTLQWPPQSTSEMLRYQRSQYPAAAWDEAVARFESLDQADQREVNRLWAQEHERRSQEHRQGWQDLRRGGGGGNGGGGDDTDNRRASPRVRQTIAIAALLVAGLVGGVRTGAKA